MVKTNYPTSVQSIERGLTLLEALSCEKDGLGISELARRTNLPASTVHRLLSVFVRRGYITRDDGNSSYRIDTKFLGLGFHPMAFLCQIYPLICRYFIDSMHRGEVEEVFLRMATRSFSVRTDPQGRVKRSFPVPELTGSTPKRCVAFPRDTDYDPCDRLDRRDIDALIRFDKELKAWCTCVSFDRGEKEVNSSRIGAGGISSLPLSRIEKISGTLVELRGEIENSLFSDREVPRRSRSVR